MKTFQVLAIAFVISGAAFASEDQCGVLKLKCSDQIQEFRPAQGNLSELGNPKCVADMYVSRGQYSESDTARIVVGDTMTAQVYGYATRHGGCGGSSSTENGQFVYFSVQLGVPFRIKNIYLDTTCMIIK